MPFYSVIEDKVVALRKEYKGDGNMGSYLRGLKQLIDENSTAIIPPKPEEPNDFITPEREEEKKFVLSPQVIKQEPESITIIKDKGIQIPPDEVEILEKILIEKPNREENLLKILKVDEIDHQAVASKVKKIISRNSAKKKVKFENLHSALDYFKVLL